jgi:phosphate transport system permease protein
MGRAVGEAIAVTQVIGGFSGIPTSLFQPGDTLASRIAAQYQGAVSDLHVASIIYLALILLVFALLVNFSAQLIVNRFEFKATH